MAQRLANAMEQMLDFSNILNVSIAASWMILAIIVLRFLMKKAPKWMHVVLWSFVAVRLLLPFSIESAFSLIPSTETVPKELLVYEGDLLRDSAFLDVVTNPALSGPVSVEMGTTVDRVQISLVQMTPIWIAGIIVMLIHAVVSYLLLHRRVSTAVLLKNNIYQSENVDTPFVLGIVKPRIFLPFRMDDKSMEYVIAHEMSHIRRKDHLWKPFGFILLAIHWFNPFMWLAYVLLCRDIELACDERVIREMNNEDRADYSQALVSCSVGRRRIAACPLAFGEVGVKKRVRSVMNYRKPAFWILAAAALSCVLLAVCFLTNPVSCTLNNIETNDLAALTQENTAVLVSDGEDTAYVGAVERKLLLELYSIRISQKEISKDRSADRDKSNTLILNLPSGEGEQVLMSFAGGVCIHFNGDFSQVWINDSVKPTFSYEVLEPEKAMSVYYAISGRRVEGNLKTYYRNSDGTWLLDGVEYKHRLVITGRMPNAAVDSTFVYLSNLKTITFEQAWRAAGFSSNTADYFAPEDAVLVEWINSENSVSIAPIGGAEKPANEVHLRDDGLVVTEDNSLDTAISTAILKRNSGDRFSADGDLIPVEAHFILGIGSVSGTPFQGVLNHIQETVVYVHYVYHRYSCTGGLPVSTAAVATSARITLTGDLENGYTLKDFWEPNGGSAYTQDIRREFPKEIADMVLDMKKKTVDVEELESKCLSKILEYASA